MKIAQSVSHFVCSKKIMWIAGRYMQQKYNFANLETISKFSIFGIKQGLYFIDSVPNAMTCM